jgi:hypothetical protein
MLIVTQTTALGYIDLDNRAGGGARLEAATYTCTHCESVVVLNPARKRERYTCRGCNHMICDGCAVLRTNGAPCATYAQKLDELYERESRGLIIST